MSQGRPSNLLTPHGMGTVFARDARPEFSMVGGSYTRKLK
jgi:hypothetical protein